MRRPIETLLVCPLIGLIVWGGYLGTHRPSRVDGAPAALAAAHDSGMHVQVSLTSAAASTWGFNAIGGRLVRMDDHAVELSQGGQTYRLANRDVDSLMVLKTPASTTGPRQTLWAAVSHTLKARDDYATVLNDVLAEAEGPER